MLSTRIQHQLQQLGINASHCQEFVSGLKLLQLVNQIFYEGTNQTLTNKLKRIDSQKTGSNVVNISAILNYLKKDGGIQLSEYVRNVKAFAVVEEQEAMIGLIQELLGCRKDKGRQQEWNMKNQVSPAREEGQFQNLYFVSSLDKKKHNLDDSLEADIQNPQQKVVRKGSFKMLKPKVQTASKLPSEQSQVSNSHQKPIVNSKQALKQILIESNQEIEEKDDLHCRKTIPKMYEKPPMYRHSKTQKSQSKPAAETSRVVVPDRSQILKNIENLNRQIVQEERSLTLLQEHPATSSSNARKTSTHHNSNTSSRKSSRKIFKLDIPQTDDKKKRTLLEWLISINLLKASSSKYIDQLPMICNDGVIFVQIVNYYQGRGKELYYFRQPKRSAELHSNYQKLFTTLSNQLNFESPLLNQFQYFIPEAQPNAFWQLLQSIHQCYNRRVIPRERSINRYENSISRKVGQDHERSRKKKTSQSTSYKEIKFNGSDQLKSNSSVQMPRRETPRPSRGLTKKSQKLEQSQRSIHGLVQIQQPVEEFNSSVNNSRTERGYRELYLSKFKNIETPHKNRSFSNSSLSKSRMKHSITMNNNNSSRKKQVRPLVPSISLEMQLSVLNYLHDLQIEEDISELFKDPYRNGILLCKVVQKYLGLDCTVSKKPRNIQDCRNNITSVIQVIKTHKSGFNSAYESYIQDLLKGQKTLLYGLIWQLIREDQNNNRHNNSLSMYLRKNSTKQQQTCITWIRSVQHSYPQIGQFKIRTEQSLQQAILNTTFLFHYSWFLTSKKAISPTYQHPTNHIQRESNLKKVLSYLIQNKIIRSDYLWRTKALMKNQNGLLQDFVGDLVTHYNRLNQKEQIRTVNFVKYRREDSEEKEKQRQREKQQKLETTMANRSVIPSQPVKNIEEVKLEVPWMRKLGFTGSLDLTNGVILCRLLAKLTMKTVQGFKERPASRAQSLGNIRRAIKAIPKFRWDQFDILNCTPQRALDIYAFLKDRYRHAYALKGIV